MDEVGNTFIDLRQKRPKRTINDVDVLAFFILAFIAFIMFRKICHLQDARYVVDAGVHEIILAGKNHFDYLANRAENKDFWLCPLL